MRALEPEHETPLGKVARLLELVRRNRLVDDPAQLVHDRAHRVVDAVDVDPGLGGQRSRVRVRAGRRVHVVREPTTFAHLGEQAGGHATAEHGAEQLHRVAVGMACLVAACANDQVRLVGLLLKDAHRAPVLGHDNRLRPTGLARLDPAEEPFQSLVQIVSEEAAEPDHHPLGPVPAVEVGEERLPRCPAYRLLEADDVPAERLVAVQQPLVDRADVASGRVEVHVHLLDDDALLALDLVGVELRPLQHVCEHVERRVARLRGALDVVAGRLLAGERVELAADAVDLAGDHPGGRPALGALEEHVLGEMSDAARLRRLVARACGEHHDARDRLRRRYGRGEDTRPVCERAALEDRHAAMV